MAVSLLRKICLLLIALVLVSCTRKKDTAGSLPEKSGAPEIASRSGEIGNQQEENVNDSEFPYRIENGKLKVFGFELDPSSPKTDSDDIFFSKSPDNRWVLIYWGDSANWDFWLWKMQDTKPPQRVNAQAGRNVQVNWPNSSIFEIEWGGIGYSMTELFQADDLRKNSHIDDPLLIDLDRNLYVSFFLDKGLAPGIEIGKIFTSLKERFPIKMNMEYPSEAKDSIDDVIISGSEMMIKYKYKDGSLARETFTPELLRNK